MVPQEDDEDLLGRPYFKWRSFNESWRTKESYKAHLKKAILGTYYEKGATGRDNNRKQKYKEGERPHLYYPTSLSKWMETQVPDGKFYSEESANSL